MRPASLRNKTILLISPQAWGKMFLTKHHYAIELSALGNRVYFLNPPDNLHWSWKSPSSRISVQTSGIYPNLFLVSSQLFFPYLLKFHARWLFDLLMKKHVAELEERIGTTIDIVWSFDHANIFPLRYFRNAFRIFHLVDEGGESQAIKAVKYADVLLTVTNEILDKFKGHLLPKLQVNHGVAQVFIHANATDHHYRSSGKVDVGLSGNWLRPDLDHQCLLQIIEENPGVDFNFFGAYYLADTNLGGGHQDHLSFISTLQTFSNVKLHGALPYAELAEQLHKMDMFLICYDVKKDQSNGTNYHKIMEYLSTGKVIVSNNVTAYLNQPELVQMVAERSDNRKLPQLFKQVVDNLSKYNSNTLLEVRRQYAVGNTYRMHLQKIEEFICGRT